MKHFTYPVGQRPNGEELNLQVYEIHGSSQGPTAYLQASVHGAELQGNLVIRELAKILQKMPFKGKIIFIPQANPEALTQKSGQYTAGRFNPITGHNWNRNYYDLFSKDNQNKHECFLKSFCHDFLANHKTDEKDIIPRLEEAFKAFQQKAIKNLRIHQQKRGPKHNGLLNLTLQEIASEADFVFDLHTGPIATRYIYAAEYVAKDALHFGFPHILEIPHEFAGAMDEAGFMPWLHLKRTLKEGHAFDLPVSYRSYTLELGSEERIDSMEAAVDAHGIIRFLAQKGMVSSQDLASLPTQTWCEVQNRDITSTALENFVTYFAPFGALTEYLCAPGEEFEKGRPLARQYHLSEGLTLSPTEICADNSGVVINHFTSASTPQGSELYQVMEKVKKKGLPLLKTPNS